jgi:ornithine cyclodeaminase
MNAPFKPAAARVSTRFLSSRDIASITRHVGIGTLFAQLADYLKSDYLRWDDFDKSARIAKYSQFGVIELMPIADDKTYSFKCVNGHPHNTDHGLPTVMAFGALADVDTGAVELISELTLTTALRTATTSAMFARVLARPDSRVMALVGNGAQSDFQALAFHHLLGIDEIRLFDIDPAATRKLVRNLRGSGIRLQVCDSVRQAVKGADIVTTVTAEHIHARVLEADMLEPGMHINAVGGDCPGKTELDPDILRRGPVFVEYEPQTRVEGELQNMPEDFAVTPFWKVLAGALPGRENARQITIFDSVGFALEDYSALRYMRDQAQNLGCGEMIGLVPELADPKDVFGMIKAAGAQAAAADTDDSQQEPQCESVSAL